MRNNSSSFSGDISLKLWFRGRATWDESWSTSNHPGKLQDKFLRAPLLLLSAFFTILYPPVSLYSLYIRDARVDSIDKYTKQNEDIEFVIYIF
jgi:hypothetical protein